MSYRLRVRHPSRLGRSTRLLVTASWLALGAAAGAPEAAWAADHTASDEASFKAAVTAVNADVDATASITLTSNISIADIATVPALTRAVTVNLGAFQLNDGKFNSSGALSLTGAGQALLAGSSTLGSDLNVTDSTLRLNSGVTLTTPGTTQLGGSATLWVSGSGSVLTTNLLRFGATAGTVTANIENGGILHSTTTSGIVQSLGTTGGSQVNVNITGAGSSLQVDGQLGLGTVAVAGTSVTVSNGGSLAVGSALRIGSVTGTNAITPSLVVTGAGSSVTASSISFIQGAFNVLGGAEVHTSTISAGAPGGPAVLQISGASSSVTTTSTVTLGNGNGGTGVVTLTDGGALNASGLVTLTNGVGRTGVINIGGAEGSAAAAAGLLNAPSLAFGAGTGRLNFNHTDTNYTFATPISGAGAINQVAGVTHLTGNSSGYTGAVTVSGGSLRVDGTLGGAGSTVAVNSGGALGGAGTVGGAVTVSSGGAIAPGNSAGTLTIAGSLVLNAGSALLMEFGQPGTAGGALNDLIVVNGNLTLDGTLNVTQSAGGAFGPGIYRVINYSGALTDNGLDVGALPSGSGTIQTSVANQINLVVAGGGGGGGGGGGLPPPPPPLTFWNGGGQGAAGAIVGGSGTWLATSGSAWTDAGATTSGGFANGQFAIFAGQPGVVTIDNSQGAVTVTGVQFAADGYRLTGDALTLAGGAATIRVGDGTTAGAAFTATIDAALTGPAQLVKTDGGTLILTGANSYAGGTAIQGGTLVGNAASFGSGGIRDDAALAIDQASDATFANAIDGAGSLTKTGAGRLTYTGTGALTGPTTVASGVLQVDGSLAGSAVAVRGGATLAGAGTVGGVSADAGATLAPTQGAALTVNGALTQASGATFQAIIDPAAGTSNRLVVAGAATIAPGATMNVTRVGSGKLRLGDSFTVLTAAGGVTGTYSLTGDLDRVSAFLGLRDVYDANDVFLKVAQVRPLPDAGVTPNQIAAATGAQSLPDSNPVKQTLVELPDDPSAQRAFDQISGEPNATAKGVMVAQSAAVRDAALARLQDLGCAHEGRKRDAACPEDPDRAAGWAQILGGWGKSDGRRGVAGVDQDSAGFLTGLDLPLGGWRFGGFAGYSRTSWDVDARAASGDSDDYHLGAYGGRAWDGLSLKLGGGYTWHEVSGHRSVAFAAVSERLAAKYGAGALQAFAELGYRLDGASVSWEPFANVAQVRLRTDGFSETGGATALAAEAQTMQTTLATLGVRPTMQADLGGVRATLRGTLGWRSAFGDVVPKSTHRFTGGDVFTVEGAALAREAAVVEAGADFAFGDRGLASLSYGGQFGDRVTEQRVRVDVQLRF